MVTINQCNTEKMVYFHTSFCSISAIKYIYSLIKQSVFVESCFSLKHYIVNSLKMPFVLRERSFMENSDFTIFGAVGDPHT